MDRGSEMVDVRWWLVIGKW